MDSSISKFGHVDRCKYGFQSKIIIIIIIIIKQKNRKASSVDPDATSRLIQFYTVCICMFFWLERERVNPYFERIILLCSSNKIESIHCSIKLTNKGVYQT